MFRNKVYAVSVIFALSASLASGATIITVKLVKDTPSRCASPAGIEIPDGPSHWHLVNKPYFQGENDREIFFDIESSQAAPDLPLVTIAAPGVHIVRAIVGRTDVPFHQVGDRVSLRLVDDRAQGQLMQTDYQSPRGGLPISFRHEWQMRRNGKYLADPYPETQAEAIPNYLVAAQEALRLMGYGAPGVPRSYDGNVVLMGCENAATRGHMDYPPHFHIMHYEYDLVGPDPRPGPVDDLPLAKAWRSRLAPHFYMDDQGRVVSNHFAVIVGAGKSQDLGVGQTCTLSDSKGRFVLDLTVLAGGGLALSNRQITYTLRADPQTGAKSAVCAYRGDTLAFRVQVRDDAEHGRLRYQIDTFRGGDIVETFNDGFDYDPFTACFIKRDVR